MRLGLFGIGVWAIASGCGPDKAGTDSGDGTVATGNCITVAETQEAALTEVGMVLQVTFDTDASVDATVVFAAEDGVEFRTPVSTSTSHSHTLRGVPPIQEISWHVEIGTESCPVVVTNTGPPTAETPKLVLSVNEPTLHDGGYIMGANVASVAVTWMVNREGLMVWDYQHDADHQGTDAKPAVGIDGVSMNLFNVDRSIDDSKVLTVAWDGSLLDDRETVLGHHAFVEQDDGDLAYVAIDVRNALVDGVARDVVGDALHIRAPDGTVTEVWNVWDHPEQIPLEDHEEDNFSFYPQGWDWIHINGFDHDVAQDRWLLSMRNVNTVVEVDASGAETLSFGLHGKWTLVGIDAADIKWPHNSNYTSSGSIVTFVSPGGDLGHSKVVELARDDATETLTVVWEHDCLVVGKVDFCLSKVEGAAHRLANGNMLVSWGAVGVLQEITADHQIAWEGKWPLGHVSGHIHHVADPYEIAHEE